MQIKIKIVSCYTANSKPVKQEVNGTGILPPLVFLVKTFTIVHRSYAITLLALATMGDATQIEWFLGVLCQQCDRKTD